MAAVVAKGDGLGQGQIQATGPGDGQGHLGDLQGVGQPGPLVIVGKHEHLGLAGRAAEMRSSAGSGPGPARSRLPCGSGSSGIRRSPAPCHGSPRGHDGVLRGLPLLAGRGGGGDRRGRRPAWARHVSRIHGRAVAVHGLGPLPGPLRCRSVRSHACTVPVAGNGPAARRSSSQAPPVAWPEPEIRPTDRPAPRRTDRGCSYRCHASAEGDRDRAQRRRRCQQGGQAI